MRNKENSGLKTECNYRKIIAEKLQKKLRIELIPDRHLLLVSTADRPLRRCTDTLETRVFCVLGGISLLDHGSVIMYKKILEICTYIQIDE